MIFSPLTTHEKFLLAFLLSFVWNIPIIYHQWLGKAWLLETLLPLPRLLFTAFPNWCEISLLALQPVSKLLFYESLCVSLDLVRPQRLGWVQPSGAPLGLQSISCFSICPSSRGSWQCSPDSLPCSAEDSLAHSPWFWCLLLLLGSGTCWRNEVCSLC